MDAAMKFKLVDLAEPDSPQILTVWPADATIAYVRRQAALVLQTSADDLILSTDALGSLVLDPEEDTRSALKVLGARAALYAQVRDEEASAESPVLVPSKASTVIDLSLDDDDEPESKDESVRQMKRRRVSVEESPDPASSLDDQHTHAFLFEVKVNAILEDARTLPFSSIPRHEAWAQATDDHRNPTQCLDRTYLFARCRNYRNADEILGKWLIFGDASTIDGLWRFVQHAVTEEGLAPNAKVTTARSPSYVICVYTSEGDLDSIGRVLIRRLRCHNIKYKRNQETYAGVYGPGSCFKILYWNRGRLSYTKPPRDETPKQSSKWAAVCRKEPLDRSIAIRLCLDELEVNDDDRETLQTTSSLTIQMMRDPVPGCPHGLSVWWMNREQVLTKIGSIRDNEAKLVSPWIERSRVKWTEQRMCGFLNYKGDWLHDVYLEGEACETAVDILGGMFGVNA